MAFKIVNDPIIPAASVDPKPAAKHFDIVLGLDFHVLKVPWPITPCPITPFAALVFDPMDYIHFTVPAMPVYTDDGFTIAKDVPLGGTVLINDCYRGAAQSALWGMPSVPPLMGKLKGLGKAVKALNLLHSVIPHPLFLLPKFFHPHEGQLSHGSNTVITQGMYQSTFLCRAYSCQDVGKILMNNPTGGFYLNFLTAVMVVLPLGKPVIVGGPKVEQELKLADLINALMLMGLMHGLKFAVKMLGKLLTKLMAKIEAKFPGFKKYRAAVQPYVCKYLGEPVDAASGHMVSYLEGFTLPGPIPFVWEANYYSDSNYDGPLGKNIYHSYDITLMVDDADSMVVMNDTAGRPVVFPVLRPGTSFYNPMEKYELHRDEKGEYFVSHKDGLYYYFNKPLQGSNGHGNLRSIVNRDGFAILFHYNSTGNLKEIVDSAGRSIQVENNNKGQITALYVPHPELGNTGISVAALRYSYNEQGGLTVLENAEGFQDRFAWEERKIIARKFKDNTVFNFRYDIEGRCTAALGPEGLYSYTFKYIDGLTIATNSLGHVRKYFHRNGIVSQIENSRGDSQFFHYDETNNLISESNELGVSKTFSYDDRGNLVEMQLPGKGVVHVIYNEIDKPVETILPNGGKWIYEYDEAGKMIKRINPEGGVTDYSYRVDGMLQSIKGPMGRETLLAYDAAYNLKQVTLPGGLHVQYYYDQLGRCTQINTPRGNQRREYNLLGKVVQFTDPGGQVHDLSYDSMGNLINAKNRHQEVKLQYDFFGNVTRQSQGGVDLNFIYDTEGQLLTVVNELNEKYRFELDEEGNVVTEIGFDGLVRRYLRDEAGQVLRLFRSNGKENGYEYNAAGQLATVFYAGDGSSEHYEYDVMGRLIKAVNDDAEVMLVRDIMGRILTETSNGNSVDCLYNLDGNRTHVSSNLGANIDIEYDTRRGWRNEVNANGWQSRIQYNSFGEEFLRESTGGLVEQNEYDSLGRLYRQEIVGNKKRVKHQRNYSWDADRLTKVQDSSTGEKQFLHDVHGNLSEVIYGDGSTEFRMPDAVGNIYETSTRTDRKYNPGGQLAASKDAKYLYDAEGNLIEKNERNGDRWEFHWNQAGMLERVLRPDGDEVSFWYDALGRRIRKQYRKTITNYVWDGNKPLHEWKEFATKDSSVEDIITWVFDEDNFAPIAKIKGDKKYSIVNDHLGTPIQGYNEDGELIWQRELDSYGRPKMRYGDSGFCPYLYQGQSFDPETGLAYNRFRYYAPEEGMYISPDPIGLEGNNPTMYGYVKDPNRWMDIFGLDEIPAWKGPADYSSIESKRYKIKEGKDYSKAQKDKIYELNKQHNDGLLRSDLDGTVLEPSQKSVSGVTPSQLEGQVDHKYPRSQGGKNSFENAQVLSRKQNRDKSDKVQSGCLKK
ncbi:hypothetical protein DBR43_00675 [Pedobacter sp. KBW06]|uniref:DUF6531 domain-containing protein n=1 Tax=Pedobacter sp. KBW06 TaxID=2153359 RepID=UPI000F5B3878|nr:DUF6531 domain-containing protein [Pedobacter sp. KBW06]RQO73955.1 hypothetical protein DBR43_00675 [Pedobacter sp. KBW06]